ncbi:MAG: trigger factor [Actinomycetota bacterium]|nr:MAG: trigger factor [Actinomycetota bacterium]
MQTTLENTDKHTVKLTVEVEPERFGRDLERAYRKVAEQVRIPGFRKGKAPRPIIDAQVGRETVLAEFLEEAVPVYYREALREHELAPISQPDIDLHQLEEGKPFVFSATVEVRPRLRFTEADYKGIRVERPAVEVTEEEVDRLLDALRERFAELEPVQRPAMKGDYVLIDLRATVHGQEVPEATRPDFLYEVGAGEFTGKLDEELQGKRAGEILRFNATLDDRFGDRAGQEVSFQVLVKEVKGKRLPEADDGFARTASEFDTLEELRAALREQLEANKRRAADAEVRDRVLRTLVERTEVDLPETLVQEETEHRVAHARERAEQLGLTLERLLELQGTDELRFRAEAREHAVRAIVSDLVLEAVARAEDLQVTAEELAAEIGRLARALGRDPKEVATSLEQSGQIVALAGDIIRSKALDVLVEHAEIVPEDGATQGGEAGGAPTEPPAGDEPPADNPEELA